MIRPITKLLMLLTLCFSSLVVADEEYWEYTFRPGDSLWEIAKQYTSSVNNWAVLREINKKHLGPDGKILAGSRLEIPVDMLKAQPTPALVTVVHGEVSVVRANGRQEQAAPGLKLYSGDKVITGELQTLRIQFADKSELQVLPNSEVVFDKLSHHQHNGMVDTQVRLISGSVNTRVKKQNKDSRYQIRTPSSVTAVRGTEYRVSLDGVQVSRTEVIEGMVDVAAGSSEKLVNDGYGIVATKDSPLPDPVKLLQAPDVDVDLFNGDSELELSWDRLDGAQSYRYQLAADENFNTIVVDALTTDHVIRLNELDAGEYYARVRGVDQHKLEGFNSMSHFEIQPAPVIEEKPAYEHNTDLYWYILVPIGMVLLFAL